ncbi:sigma-70 family RNA polymerase sigma factor [Cryomorphaceae bacterium 1068]|nr:sigma-70 family RNA polymerase sigma factor [Cryomorphaceae bacterium 1068]
MRLFEEGDVKAMNLLYDHYSDALYGVVLRMVGDEALASDVLQESFVKIWKNSRSYDPSKGRLFTWLLRIVKNKAIDSIRKTGRKAEIQTELKIVYKDDASDSTDPTLEHDLNTVLSNLDQDQRELIEHSYILGYSHPEIAEKFDMPLGTVKTRIRNAMKELRSIFGNGR